MLILAAISGSWSFLLSNARWVKDKHDNKTKLSVYERYLWWDDNVGLECFVVVLGQELVEQQVELLSQLTGVCSQGSEPCCAARKLFLGLRRWAEPPTVRPERRERGGLRRQSHRRENVDITPAHRTRCWQPGLSRHIFLVTYNFPMNSEVFYLLVLFSFYSLEMSIRGSLVPPQVKKGDTAPLMNSMRTDYAAKKYM